jgi:hypothetical protein
MQEPDSDDLGKRVVGLVADHSQRAVAGYFWALFEAVPGESGGGFDAIGAFAFSKQASKVACAEAPSVR